MKHTFEYEEIGKFATSKSIIGDKETSDKDWMGQSCIL